jgi:predicted DCC family thiol-disulfide oxidoreductase YuxK
MSDRIVFFDGVCNLCNGFVQFVIPRDPEGRFKFAPLQSDVARARLGHSVVPGSAPSTVLLFQNDRLYDRSTAVLLILRQLRFPWPVAGVLFVIPRSLRDWVYGFVARRRYGWFGQRETCMVPTPEIKSRFLS